MSIERLDKLSKNLKALNIEAMALEIIEDNRPLLEDMNAAQLEQGLRSDGSDIRPEYAPLTVEIKKAKGQVYDRVTLRDTGDFRESIRIQTARNELTFDATDPKADELEEKYGSDIYGLADDDRAEFLNSYMRPDLQDKIRKQLNQ